MSSRGGSETGICNNVAVFVGVDEDGLVMKCIAGADAASPHP